MHRQILASIAALLLLSACASRSQQSADAAAAGAGAGAAQQQQGIGQGGLAAPPAAQQQAAAQPPRTGPAPGSVQQFTTEVGDRVYFDFDKYDLSPQARATLERQAQWLRLYPNVRIQVEGHCDERGTREYNLALGERRANAVVNYLVALGVPANRITMISYGKERPVAIGSNETAWALNRRGVSVIQSGAVVN